VTSHPCDLQLNILLLLLELQCPLRSWKNSDLARLICAFHQPHVNHADDHLHYESSVHEQSADYDYAKVEVPVFSNYTDIQEDIGCKTNAEWCVEHI
jgi:hypothetical protein